MNLKKDTTEKFEQEIDAALKMLNEVQSPPAMASRIHQSLETVLTTSQECRLGGRFWGLACYATMTAVLFVVFSQIHWAPQISSVETAKLVTNPPASPRCAASQQPLAPAKISREPKPFVQPARLRHSRPERTQHRHAANLLSYPLTRQERLLVRFAQMAKPEDLRDLNPEYQARVEAQQEAEFAAYLKSGSGSSAKETAN